MQRVMIIGQPGSGKSTLARKLGAATGLPVYHMDHIHWMPGWVQRPDPERWEMVREVHARERWIFEGGFSKSWPERAARADTIIWLDVGVWRRLWRVTRRFVRGFGKVRPDMAEGCPEGGDLSETLEFYRFIWRTRTRARKKLAATLAAHGTGKHVLVLRQIAEVEAFVEEHRA